LAAVAGSDTETRLPINVAALLISIEARRIAANIAKLPELLSTRTFPVLYIALSTKSSRAQTSPDTTRTPTVPRMRRLKPWMAASHIGGSFSMNMAVS
jgi:hypothetical protein